MLTFENSVAAMKFVAKCQEEKLWDFEVVVGLGRTGTGGAEGKGKWEGYPERQVQGRPPQSRPLWLEIDEQGGFEQGAGIAAMERAGDQAGAAGEKAMREAEVMMREG